MAAPQLPDVLTQSIDRCASALSDIPRLKHEVAALKATGEGLAHFASALFELELARRGDVESRQQLSHLAEVLLVFWRDGSGDALSQLHPAMESLWQSVSPMLVQFEGKQFDLTLMKLWKVRSEPNLLHPLVVSMGPNGNHRVEFARCLYHLELARQGVDSSRAEFAKRVSLLSDAYQDQVIADELIGHDGGLRELWGEVKPYLDEFFEHLEEQAARAQDATRKVQMPVAPQEEKPALGTQREVPSFRTLTGAKTAPSAPAQQKPSQPRMSAPVPQGPRPSAPPAPAVRAPPPPPPANLTPPGGWVPDADVVIDEADVMPAPSAPPPPPSIPAVRAPPPPPVDLTPPGSWRPPTTASGEVELVDAIEVTEAPPPPPPVTPSHGLAAVIEAEELDMDLDPEPDDATLAFWEYTFASLQSVVGEGATRARMLASESRADRKRLTTWLDGMKPHLPVPEGRAFAALVRLMLAAQTKEKSLFGAANPRRKEGLEAAFSLLHGNAPAAGHAAVWFELDGDETRAALHQGLELLMAFLAFCGRHSLDPLDPSTVQKYVAS